MTSNFQRCVDFVIDELEGGDSLVVDTGGATRYGISSRGNPDVNVRELSRTGAEEIYRKRYWEPLNCDTLAWPMDLIVFDTAVNQGPAFAHALASDPGDYLEALMLRVERYAQSASDASRRVYFRGWINRVLKVWRFARLGD